LAGPGGAFDAHSQISGEQLIE
jgi:hypothetical protein